ncbi:MAG: preprotein translocase subunit YajC [Spirochaetia bacterium]
MEQTVLEMLPLLQEGSATGQLVTTFVTFGLVILIFYFLIIRPQNKKQKETEKMIAALKKGDKIVSIGGIHGTIQSVKEKTAILKIDDNVKIEISKSAVSTVTEQKSAKSEATEEENEKK